VERVELERKSERVKITPKVGTVEKKQHEEPVKGPKGVIP